MGKYIKRKAMSVVPPAAGTISDSVNVIDEKTTAPSIDLTKRITGIPVDGVIVYEGDELNIPEGYEQVNSGMFLPIGAGCDYYGATAPVGFMFADGSAISRIKYEQLFKIIGTMYGAGDGKTTFNLPDKRSRVSVMSDKKELYDMKLKTLSDGSKWARIFYHNSKKGTVLFTSVAEAKNTQTENKYSRLYLLDDNTFKDPLTNKFEFMLCYPTDTTSYNRWKQTNSPCNEFIANTTNGSKVAGYEAISIAWTAQYWGGLCRQNESITSTNNCYLSGSTGHSNWYYAIAPFIEYNGGMPSTSDIVTTTSDGVTANDVEIWVRYDNAFTLGKQGGEFVHTLTTSEMPSHTHIQNAHNHRELAWGNGSNQYFGVNSSGTGTWRLSYTPGASEPNFYTNHVAATNQNTGGSQAHNNLQPYLVCNYIIRVE